MNWKLKLGEMLQTTEQGLIKLNSKFVCNNCPLGRDWLFNAKIILGDTSVIVDAWANIGAIDVLYYRSGNQGSLSGQISKIHGQSAYYSLLKSSKFLIAAEDNSTTRLLSANSLQQSRYSVYPDFPERCASIKKDIKDLGGSTIKWRSAGWGNIVEKPIGWKSAKKISIWLR